MAIKKEEKKGNIAPRKISGGAPELDRKKNEDKKPATPSRPLDKDKLGKINRDR